MIVGDCDTPGNRGRRLDRLREAEIEHLHGPVRADLDVGRLEIAMDDALLVRRVERLGDLPRDRQRLVERDRTSCDAVGERLTLDQFHHERLHTSAVFEAVDGGDVRMVQ